MSIRKNFIAFSIVINLLFATIALEAYCDNWVYIGESDNSKLYYYESKIDINRKNKQIKVWVKINREINDKEIKKLIGKIKTKELELIVFDYANWKYRVMSEVNPSMEEIWGHGSSTHDYDESVVKWHNIIPESINDIILNKIIKDYKTN